MCAGSGGRSNKPERCKDCWAWREAGRVDARARKIEGWWAGGLTLREIADRLGWTKGHISHEIHRLREKGYSLPYRAGAKFPEQVAA
jgi:transposase